MVILFAILLLLLADRVLDPLLSGRVVHAERFARAQHQDRRRVVGQQFLAFLTVAILAARVPSGAPVFHLGGQSQARRRLEQSPADRDLEPEIPARFGRQQQPQSHPGERVNNRARDGGQQDRLRVQLVQPAQIVKNRRSTSRHGQQRRQSRQLTNTKQKLIKTNYLII